MCQITLGYEWLCCMQWVLTYHVLCIPIVGAFEVLARMGSTHDLVVVTSRQHVIQDVTLEWIDRHYPGMFQEVYFGNHFALEGVSRKKSDICRQVLMGYGIHFN